MYGHNGKVRLILACVSYSYGADEYIPIKKAGQLMQWNFCIRTHWDHENRSVLYSEVNIIH